MTTCDDYRARLLEAEAALHKANLGRNVESIQDGENRITYSKGDLVRMETYLKWLQRKVDVCDGKTAGGSVIHFIPVDR